jgi:hypothetical protein
MSWKDRKAGEQRSNDSAPTTDGRSLHSNESEEAMPEPKKKQEHHPADADIDCADLDDLSRMLAAIMSASTLGTITLKEGYAKFRRIRKRADELERERRGS